MDQVWFLACLIISQLVKEKIGACQPSLFVIETQINGGAKADGKKVGEIKWPEGCVLVGLLKGLHATVPSADDVLSKGDQVFAVVANKAEKKFLKLVH